MAGDLRDLRRIDRRRRRRRAGCRGGAGSGALANQVERGLHLARQIRRAAVTVHVHVEHARLVPEEVVVQSRNLEAVVEQRGHHRIDLVLRQDEVAHHHIHAAGAFGHRDPAAEAERRRRLDVARR